MYWNMRHTQLKVKPRLKKTNPQLFWNCCGFQCTIRTPLVPDAINCDVSPYSSSISSSTSDHCTEAWCSADLGSSGNAFVAFDISSPFITNASVAAFWESLVQDNSLYICNRCLRQCADSYRKKTKKTPLASCSPLFDESDVPNVKWHFVRTPFLSSPMTMTDNNNQTRRPGENLPTLPLGHSCSFQHRKLYRLKLN